MGQFKIENFEKIHRWTLEKIQKFGQKMKNFEIFFDVHMMDTSMIELSRRSTDGFFQNSQFSIAPCMG